MIPVILSGGSVASSSAEVVITTDAVAPRMMFTALSIMAMDEDSAIATLIEIGVLDGSKRIPIDSTPGSYPAATSHTIYWPSMLLPGQRYYAKFLTPTAGDHLSIVAHGYCEIVDMRRPSDPCDGPMRG